MSAHDLRKHNAIAKELGNDKAYGRFLTLDAHFNLASQSFLGRSSESSLGPLTRILTAYSGLIHALSTDTVTVRRNF